MRVGVVAQRSLHRTEFGGQIELRGDGFGFPPDVAVVAFRVAGCMERLWSAVLIMNCILWSAVRIMLSIDACQ
jgi:hypothetical protein